MLLISGYTSEILNNTLFIGLSYLQQIPPLLRAESDPISEKLFLLILHDGVPKSRNT